MKAAGVRDFGASVELLDLPDPRPPRADEVLIAVRAAAVAAWDDVVRTGSWDVGGKPPMALGVAAAGVVTAVGEGVAGIEAGVLVATHSVPLRDQGTWAQALLVPASDVAPVPQGVSAEAAAVAAVPALTADQALVDALGVQPGQTVLVTGAGGVTGGIAVQLAVSYGARVIATASADSANRVYALGARTVADYRQPGWPAHICELTGGVDAAVNAAPGGAAAAAITVRDGGRLATITGDPPQPGRGIEVASVYVTANGPRLARLLTLLAAGTLTIEVAARHPLEEAAAALEEARHGTHGAGVVLIP